MKIGNRIRRLRKQNKLTQKKFAEMVGITSRTLCQYEKGGRTPKIDKIKKIAEIFSVSVDYLVGESDEETDTHVTRECHEERVNILLRQRDNLADYVKHLKKEIKERESELETLKFKTDCRNSWKNKFFKAQEENEYLKQHADQFLADYQKAQKQVDELKDELKNLDWYKMWHNKHKKEIYDLTLEMETYRPTKLSGNGQCKCSNCGSVSWTDWFSRYKGQTLCNKCLKEIVVTEENQVVKDTAKEIWEKAKHFYRQYPLSTEVGFCCFRDWVKDRYGVEVE